MAHSEPTSDGGNGTERGTPSGAIVTRSLSMLVSSSIANVSLPTLVQTSGVSLPERSMGRLGVFAGNHYQHVGVGKIGDMFGRRRVLLGGLALYTLASIARGLAPSL